jgi:hypothetical protein
MGFRGIRHEAEGQQRRAVAEGHGKSKRLQAIDSSFHRISPIALSMSVAIQPHAIVTQIAGTRVAPADSTWRAENRE